MDFQLGDAQGSAEPWTEARTLVKDNAGYALALIIVLIIAVSYYTLYRCACKVAEKFNPGQTMMYQDSDQVGTGNRYQPFEHATGDRSETAFAKQVQSSPGGQLAYVQGSADTPGSMSYQILHSPDFNCDKRTPIGSDAWSWMNGVAQEQATGHRIVEGATGGPAQPRSANDLSRIMAGH